MMTDVIDITYLGQQFLMILKSNHYLYRYHFETGAIKTIDMEIISMSSNSPSNNLFYIKFSDARFSR